ncbi:MAG: twin-arginine translocase subunit TatC [Bacteroidetes bacterium]|nr:twin-arginine translocase subunit TatC [Bacteroidota bacterium]MDA0902985.1 twin-arginine translocase subunit TatC [Bacteroidota bacterium]MDA1241599.1 twin-arginine translocase subunit TatC [Bacteroidota bacterium]
MPKDQAQDEAHMGFLDHLEELRKRLFISALAVLVGAVALFVQKDWVFDRILFGPRNIDFITYRAWCGLSHALGSGDALCVDKIGYELINTTMLGNFSAHIIVSLVGGVIVAFPVIIHQIWAFVRPALKQGERQAARGAGLASSVLFMAGVAFGYFGIAPLSLQFLGNYELGDVASRIAVMSYVKTVASITLAAGLVFQLPVLVFFLSKAGLVTADMLRSYRRHALVVILALSAVITPPDVTSQILVSLPVLVLYELGIVIARTQDRRRTAKP